nr:ferredoxin-type protein NapF [Aliikangiella sp. G2MR2-5]
MFRRITGKSARLVRPPWSPDEDTFLALCSRCNHCVATCESKIIKIDDDPFPYIDFNSGECTFCKACVNSCDTGALSLTNPAFLNLEISIEEGCLANNQTYCQTCQDVCEKEAISFPLQVHSIPKPVLNTEDCTYCGACIPVCPVQAIEIFPTLNNYK